MLVLGVELGYIIVLILIYFIERCYCVFIVIMVKLINYYLILKNM